LNARWVEPDVRDEIVEFVKMVTRKTEIPIGRLAGMIGFGMSKYYTWKRRYQKPNIHTGDTPRKHWIVDWEREAILSYARLHRGEGYRRLTYMMLDEDVVAVSPSTTYRVMKRAGLLNIWEQGKDMGTGKGFEQPTKPHQRWHTDIKYVNFRGTFLFLLSVIDGYSRTVVHHELRTSMQEYDVQMTIQRALEKYPGVRPRLITNNGSQYISKDFTEYLRSVGLQHVRTSIAYPQSNGKIERYHRTIHEECLAKKSLLNLDDARKQIADTSSLFYLTPDDFLNNRITEKLTIRNTKLRLAQQARYEVRYAG